MYKYKYEKYKNKYLKINNKIGGFKLNDEKNDYIYNKVISFLEKDINGISLSNI